MFLILFLILKSKNDKADEEKIRAEVKKQLEEEEKAMRINEKANKIVTSMDQFGNLIE